MLLTDEIALVTGASRGIGKAIALQLAQQGATVIGTATKEEGAQAITHWMQAEGVKGEGMALNVNDADAITQIIDQINERHGSVTILVNNAGITRDNLMMRMKDEEWDDIIQTNLTAVFRVTRAVLRGMMKARKGRIIHVGSVVGSAGNAGQTNYAAAKAGLLGLAKSLAREVGSRGITVNTVAPGFIDTDMTRNLPEAHREALLGQIPLARLGQPEEIAATVAFLASPAAAYITGETLHVNGGMFMP
ncbi:3-oxoacyl-[acyl-carrier-protein] reductase [Ectothiorhodosinus mongolicus]|uniref:3-oxoacyl-[acyl-carrier-protein] reductase n=1 Tax=Ectothiorhodosinus mongolicus TaxID=233100 RepID=A0A1R3VML0_9GAMM|nr:3-oxoacyl-ACP reductase FabG [Ectothiorhodosinus mongolicus]ULX56271.1 3-oxoacyl-ACP reductase FabG [Ectothiorhodosinus mongolicus]SIT65776.1 3-oxoacyl-[acyl-carrier-protein] reductase [Ectothiorhodosinus mongolicus]